MGRDIGSTLGIRLFTASSGSEIAMSVEYVSQLLDLVYEAASVPELWPVALDKLAKMAGGAGTFLFTADPRTVRLTSSDSLKQLGADIFEGGWHEKNARLERAIQRRHTGFVREI